MAAAPVVPQGCEAGLVSFNQFTGQCWNDASMTMMLFAGGSGLTTQQAVIDSGDQLPEIFKLWCDLYPEFIQSMSAAGPVDMAVFKEYASSYVECFKDRYANWLNSLASRRARLIRAPLQRCESIGDSLCQEAAGILTGELLASPDYPGRAAVGDDRTGEFRDQARAPLIGQTVRNALAAFRAARRPAAAQMGQLPGGAGNNPQFFTGQHGYYPSKFGRVVCILLKFFVQDKLFAYYNFAAVGRANGEPELRAFLASLPGNQERLYFLYNTGSFNARLQSPIRNINLLRMIPDEYNVSTFLFMSVVQAGVGGFPTLGYGGHATCLIQCDDRSQYFYDDEVNRLIPIDWRSLVRIYDQIYFIRTNWLPGEGGAAGAYYEIRGVTYNHPVTGGVKMFAYSEQPPPGTAPFEEHDLDRAVYTSQNTNRWIQDFILDPRRYVGGLSRSVFHISEFSFTFVHAPGAAAAAVAPVAAAGGIDRNAELAAALAAGNALDDDDL